jgi:hypothetical protein
MAERRDPSRKRLAIAGVALVAAAATTYFVRTGRAPPIPQYGAATEAESRRWVEAIRERARDGDWIAIRGYHPADHLVAGATLRPLSHAAILDLTRGEVIEAVSPRVRVVSLESFVDHTHRFEIIRPAGATPESGKAAVEQARGKIGTPYDFLGTIGLPSEKRAYCSELCAWAWGIEVDRNGPDKVLHPADMVRYGARIFEAGPRKLALPTLP